MGMLTLTEAARQLATVGGPGVETLRKRAQRGRLEGAQQIDGTWHIELAAVEEEYARALAARDSRPAVPPPAPTAVVVHPGPSTPDSPTALAVRPDMSGVDTWTARLDRLAIEVDLLSREADLAEARLSPLDRLLGATEALVDRLERRAELAERRAAAQARLDAAGGA